MNTKWRKCIELMLKGDMNQKQIAKELKVTEQTIINWKKDERFQELKFKMEREVLKNMTSKAFRTLNELLDSESDTVRFYAVRDILDRSGHKAVDISEVTSKSEVNVVNNPLTELSSEELIAFIAKADDEDEDK